MANHPDVEAALERAEADVEAGRQAGKLKIARNVWTIWQGGKVGPATCRVRQEGDRVIIRFYGDRGEAIDRAFDDDELSALREALADMHREMRRGKP